MILAFVLILVLCSALSFPQYNRFNNDISDIKLIPKKNTQLSAAVVGDDLDLVDESEDRITATDSSKRNLENTTLGKGLHQSQKSGTLRCEPFCSSENRLGIRSTDGNTARLNDDDILLHLNNDKDLYKFLEWTMEQLGSVNSYNASGSYYTGLNMWKKALRGLPLYVEEPKYIVVHREPNVLERKLNLDNIDNGFSFISRRGRKVGNLEKLFAQPDIFIQHRGKKNKLKDIFKDDELFFPLRGKKRTSSVEVVEGADGGGVLQQGKNKMRTSSGDDDGGYYNNNYRMKSTSEAAPARNDRRAFGDWLASRCDDIAAAVATSPHQQQQQLVTNQAGNINALVSAAFHLPQPCQAAFLVDDAYDDDDDDAISADGHQDACALAAAACQKENDVKINGFDQSAREQLFKGGAFNNQQRNRQRQRQRRLLSSASSSSSSESVEAGASTFLPLTQSDQLKRLQQYPIRNKQWKDYYARQMATLSTQFPPF